MEDDDIQDFDLRWEQALFLTNDLPSDKDLEGLYVSKMQDSSQAHTIMTLFNQEILRGDGQKDYHRLRLSVKLIIEEAKRRKTTTTKSEITERGVVIQKKKDKILLPNGTQENTINGKQLGLALKENLAVFYVSLSRETEK